MSPRDQVFWESDPAGLFILSGLVEVGLALPTHLFMYRVLPVHASPEPLRWGRVKNTLYYKDIG